MAVYYMNAPAPYVIEENLGDYIYEDDDISLAEVLQDQEIVYESFQKSGQSANVRSNPRNGQNLSGRAASRSVQADDAQLAVDEAIAKELQDIENQLLDVSLHDNNASHAGRVPPVSSTGDARRSPVNIPIQAPPRQDVIDPDRMTYEELQELGEAIGTESRGLSDQMIAYLPTSNYKIGGIFSRKDKYQECVICCMAYKNKDKLITLPCEHKYHKDCVTKWLKINKTCPVCGKEVFGS